MPQETFIEEGCYGNAYVRLFLVFVINVQEHCSMYFHV